MELRTDGVSRSCSFGRGIFDLLILHSLRFYLIFHTPYCRKLALWDIIGHLMQDEQTEFQLHFSEQVSM